MSDAGPGQVLGPRQARFLTCLAERIVPEVADAAPDVQSRLVAVVDAELAQRPRNQQLQVKLLLFVLRWMTLLPFERLPGRWQDALLHLLEGAPLTILRVGIWGLKTLIFMGYYSQNTVDRRIHYDPSKTEGNAILHRLQGKG